MFNEENSVENFVRDLLTNIGWKFVPRSELNRAESDVLVEENLVNALIRLNPLIAENPGRADEIIYKLRAIFISVRGSGLVKANEEFSRWLKNEKTMPFGERGEHVSIKLIDYENPENNEFVVTTQYSYTPKRDLNRRPDLVLLVNGIPLIVGEVKSPVRPSVPWLDGAIQLEDYQKYVPELFVPNAFCFASEGKRFRVGSVKLPIEKWQPWRTTTDTAFEQLEEVKHAVNLMLRPEVVLDLVKNFTLFSTNQSGQKIKILCRYQQYEATKQIVQRVIEGRIRKGLIWHFQGSGKSYLMVYAGMQLRQNPELRSPTAIVVVDRIDLNSQISATFNASNIPNTVTTESRDELKKLLEQDTRKIIITTIHKFAEADGVLNERENIIVLVDEAHRTQEGDLGKKMRESLPNAFLFGLTGTPINTRDRNTFWAFGAEEDENGYMNKYSFEQSLKDKATLPIYFVPRPVDLHINQKAIDEAFHGMIDQLEEDDKIQLSKRAGKFGVLVKVPDRIEKVCKNIVEHYKKNIGPGEFKGQIVTFDREACHLYKQEIDKYIDPEESAVVMTLRQGDPEEWKKKYSLTDDELAKLLDRFRDPADPLKLLIVTSKLLTGFDAPINQAMHLDKPMKDHTLLQAICRVNRPYPNKDHGLVVDYLGIFDNVANALNFDIKEIQNVISNINNLKEDLPIALEICLAYFEGIDRSIEGYEGLLPAQECLLSNEIRDNFAADYSYLARHWETISSDSFLNQYEPDYKWLTQVYQSVKPTSGDGKLVWYVLGPKTLDLIHENTTVQTIRDDLETLIMDADILGKISEKDAKKKADEIEIKIEWKLHKNAKDPKFKELGKRLEELKDKHYKNTINSIEFLKGLLEIAKETVKLEREIPAEPVDDTKEALTKLFFECKIEKTPVIVEKIVSDIDNVVKYTRFDGWQWTDTGEKEIKKALRKTLLKYKLHKDQELFDKAYDYIREHY
ncbi:TPA: type I restriction endonuclease subunit R [Methanosarcinaceae archaeon]|nr:type I restriction endonuclease subunit R [Methanosarcinaceae archaeon]